MINIALCFCVRNCEKYLNNIFSNIEDVKKLNNINVYSIFIYDNCEDNSEMLLKEYSNSNNNTIVRNIENKNPSRTVRIAKARNSCLQIVYNESNDISFHIMIDCDDVCINKWNIELLNNYLNNFDNDDWDCISFNRIDYYDIWALIYDDFKHHCWGFYNKSYLVVEIMGKCLTDKLNNSKTNSIEVESAFNGFCIYKTDRFKGFYYDGYYSNVKKIISDNERLKTVKMFKDKYNINVICNDNHIECCEHIFYNISAHKKGRKIKISKYIMV